MNRTENLTTEQPSSYKGLSALGETCAMPDCYLGVTLESEDYGAVATFADGDDEEFDAATEAAMLRFQSRADANTDDTGFDAEQSLDGVPSPIHSATKPEQTGMTW